MESLAGEGFSDLDRLTILDTCGRAFGAFGASTLVPRIPQDGLGTTTGGAVRWEGKLTAFGGSYRLCWCAGTPETNATFAQGLNAGNLSNFSAMFQCQQTEHFRVDLGQLFLVGPTYQSGATCVSGQTCSIPGVANHVDDSFALMDTCGGSELSQAADARVELGGIVWGPSPLIMPGGTYRLCWCSMYGTDRLNASNISSAATLSNNSNQSSDHSPCRSSGDYAVDTGPVLIVGPSPLLQDRTCISGHTCTIEGLLGTGSEDLMIQETCSTTSSFPVANFSNISGRWEMSSPLLQEGGIYRLCWCSNLYACDTSDDFKVDMGSLHLLGPTPLLQHRTCISGCPCGIDRLSAYPAALGGMSILVLDTCGTTDLAVGFPSTSAAIDTNTRTARWTSVTAAGGTYSLCWHVAPEGQSENATDVWANASILASNRSAMTLPAEHSIFMGQLTLVGPATDHSVTCVSGKHCAARFYGHYLSEADFVAILNTCGTGAMSQQFTAVQHLQVAGPHAVSVAWPSNEMRMEGGQYRLCWCSGANETNASRCDSTEFFRVDAGSLTVRGPVSMERTCVAGQACDIEGFRGWALTGADRVMLLNTCGLFSGMDTSQNLGEEQAASFTLTQAGMYRLCWCGSEPAFNGSITAGNATTGNTSVRLMTACDFPFEFNIDAGGVLVTGPLPAARTCVSGQRCSLDGLLGIGLSESDVVLVMDTCASPNVIPLFTNAGLVQEVGRSGSYVSWSSTEITSSGGTYRLCWCTNRQVNTTDSNITQVCQRLDNFVDFGSLVLRAPYTLANPHKCIAGEACLSSYIAGSFISPFDSVRILDTCGVQSHIPGFQVDAWFRPVSAASAWNSSLSTPHHNMSLDILVVSAAGGQYRLCWCAQEFDCVTSASYRVDFGAVELVGPEHFQLRTCISGQTCSIDSLLGLGLSNASSFLVMDTCGDRIAGSFGADAVSRSGTLVQWSHAGPVPGGLYRLCWCSETGASNATRCASSSDFQLDLGALIIRGPAPFGQSFTCVAGQRCNLDIVGQDLAEFDQTVVLDTCGVPTTAGARIRFTVEARSLSLFSEGDALIPGGEYRICWCGSGGDNHSQVCQLANDFVTDFGSLTVAGPAPLDQHTTCVSGRTCVIEEISGTYLSSGDFMLAAATCGSSQAVVHRLQNSGLMAGPGVNSTSLKWTTSVFAPGGQYRLCWCAQGQTCTTMPDFRLDLGALAILGPSPLQQDRSCVAGQHCEMDAISGFSIEGWLMVLETCGQATLGLPNVAFLTEAGSVTWGVPSIPGGQYRLCWCSPEVSFALNRSSCATSSEFTLDMGTFSLLGPAQSQSWTCVSGRRCKLDQLDGLHLPEDRLLVLETCATAAVVPGWSAAGADAAVYGVVTAAGGQYRLCWCGSNSSACGTPEAFVIDVGSLFLLGPGPLRQDRTCLSGMSCSFGGLSGSSAGAILMPGRVLVLDTCGLPSRPAGFPGDVGSVELQDVNHLALDYSFYAGILDLNGKTIVNWGTDQVTMAAGQYRLCWCATLEGALNYSSCAVASDFAVDFGGLQLYGPATAQLRTCVSGYRCALDGIAGFGLGDNDSFLLLDTCARREIIPRFADSGLVRTVSGSGAQISWDIITAHGGSYRLCWCRGDCSTAAEFHFDLGTLLLIGPRSAERTCVAGHSCHLDGLIELQDESYMLLDTCGLTTGTHFAAQAEVGQVAWEALDLAPGIYRLCWCTSLGQTNASSLNVTGAVNSSLAACQLSLQHQVDVGGLTLMGPLPDQVRTCFSGHTCVIDGIAGHYLSLQDHVHVLETCGSLEVVPGFLWEAQTQNATNLTDPISSWSSTYVTASGGIYRLCWCAGIGACSQSKDMVVDFGQMVVLGPQPLQQHHTCVSGLPCPIASSLFSVSNDTELSTAILILDTCGTSFVPHGFPVAANETLPNASSLLYLQSQLIATAFGGTYRLCWCSVAATSTCTIPLEFRTDFGELTLIGPVESSHTCISGKTCMLSELQGHHLAYGDWYMALDTCGAPVPDWPLGLVGQVSADPVPIGTAGVAGSYYLCWCAGASNGTTSASRSCQQPSDFATTAGSLIILGPSAYQDRTCVSGQSCALDGLTGTGLHDLKNLVSVLDTCGTTAEPARLPQPMIAELIPSGGMRVSWDARISTAGGVYRLCWASANQALNTSNISQPLWQNYNVDMGSLLILGPSPLEQVVTCVSGQACSFSSLSGYGMESGGQIQIANTCGAWAEEHAERFPDDGFASWTAGQYEVSWTIVVTAAGRAYRLCWCAHGFACSTAESFRVDAGALYLVGPEALSQGRTCVAGRACSFALELEGTNTSGQILIMDTCGVQLAGGALDALEAADFIGPVGSASWPLLRLSGGEYRLCWCAEDCNAHWSFQVDMGALLLLGPSLQDFTCISGHRCTLDVAVLGAAAGDQLMVADTCGVAQGDFAPALVPFVSDFDGRLSATWGQALTLPGSQYQLCWCSRVGKCNGNEYFQAQAGTLFILGPGSSEQPFTCISGQQCVVKGLLGEGLSNADTLQILDTCGEVPRNDVSTMVSDGVSWTADILSPGGLYRLCWCSPGANVSQCSVPEDFLVDAGALQLLGPQAAHFTCVAGQTCIMDGVSGHLHASDRFAVLDTCGSNSAWPTHLYEALEVSQSDASSWSLTWGVTPLSSPGGLYRLCWCSNFAWCGEASTFRVDFGSLALLGPDVLFMERTCVSGQTCSFDGLISSSGILLLDTCGLPHVGKRWDAHPIRMPHFMTQLEHMQIQNGRVDWGTLKFTGAGGEFRLCWCAQNATCALPEHFSLDIGRFLLRGPSLGHSSTCVSGQTCVVAQVEGWHLSSADRIVVLDTCAQEGNATAAPIFGFPDDGISLLAAEEVAEVVESGPRIRFDFGTISAQGGSYRLCWCGGSACSSLDSFLVDFGELRMAGFAPLQQTRTCVSGRTCSIDGLTGHYLTDGALLAVFDTCGVRHTSAELS